MQAHSFFLEGLLTQAGGKQLTVFYLLDEVSVFVCAYIIYYIN